jgi:hypothetical protein
MLWRAAGKFGCHSGPGRRFRAEPKNTGQALVSRAGVHGFRVPSLRSGAGMTGIWAFFQQPALAVSAAPAMRESATGVSEACAMPDATAEIMGEAPAHAMSEAVAEIAVRARIVRTVSPVIG